jgi:mannose/cellobiose epimerase-like protein (N-acyl-D-glucosamine 2-epimerase family)
VVDVEHGGYNVHHAFNGSWEGPRDKTLISQARVMWFFAALARDPVYGQGERHLGVARHG